VRRPQKPFTVEVKRARKGAVGKFLGPDLFKLDADPPDPAPQRQLRSLEPAVSPQKAPPRRILEAIESSEPSAMSEPPAETLQRESIVANATGRRPRGRPPKKAVSSSAPATVPVAKPQGAAKKARAASAPRKRSAPVEGASIFIPPPPPPPPPASQVPAGRVFHGERSDEASALPRGARWKRRLPKVLW
jgi:hypothetical protein